MSQYVCVLTQEISLAKISSSTPQRTTRAFTQEVVSSRREIKWQTRMIKAVRVAAAAKAAAAPVAVVAAVAAAVRAEAKAAEAARAALAAVAVAAPAAAAAANANNALRQQLNLNDVATHCILE